MRVIARDAVAPGRGRQRKDMRRIERAKPGQIEHRSKVDEERIVALAGEDFSAAWQRVYRGRGQ